MTISMVQYIIKQPFYYGEFEYPVGSDKWYKGGYDPIITKELYDEANNRLRRGNISRSQCKEFAFTKLIKCGKCGSGITAEEKIKKMNDGVINRYVYYSCARSRDIHCKSEALREEALIEQLSGLMDKIDINEIGIKDQFEDEVNRFYKFSKGILGVAGSDFDTQKDLDIRSYAKYVLRNGSIMEKREVLGCLKSKLIMMDKKIRLV